MTIQLASRLLTTSCMGIRSRWSLANRIPRRYVQEFPGLRFDNSTPKDYMIVMPESLEDVENNELLRIPQQGEPEVDFSKLNPENCFKGLSKAISQFDNFISDINNQTDEEAYKTISELFGDLEKNLFPLDTAYNVFMVLVSREGRNYNYPEIRKLLERYTLAREQKGEGRFKELLQRLSYASRGNLSLNDEKMLKIYQLSTRKRQGVQPLNENILVAQKGNLDGTMKLFLQNLVEADQNFSHTVDDPDILSAISNEFDDCQDLHHKERTPLLVTSSTYQRFMRVCPDRFVRQMLWETYNKRCSPKALPKLNNQPILSNIQVLRRKIAVEAGYRTHLEMRLEGTMAGSKPRILESLSAIQNENGPKLAERLGDVYEYAADNSFSDVERKGLREYDLDYWSSKYVHDILIGVDEAKLKNFFPFKTVMRGLQEYFKTYFSIDMKSTQRTNDKFWPDSVQFMDLRRRDQSLGRIIYSPYKRDDGRSDTYYARLRGRVQGAGHLPARFVSTSFNVDETTGEARLSVPEVLLLFKCFSTVIQRLLYNYPYYELNTYGGLEADVARLLPNLCEAHLLSDHRILQSCSIRDGSKPIDSELASRIVSASAYSRPFKNWFELYKAHLDADFHSTTTMPKNLVQELYSRYSPFPREPDNYDYCAMNEIFVGPNDGLQYADLWSKQLANFCLSQARDSNGKLNDAKTREMFNGLLDSLFSANDLTTDETLVSLTGGQRFEPSKLGLGVL